ncbi:MAG: hypothetical protein ISS25_01840 [Nanoarchaeota archaeon]|nr:hypothetical protein [DPANN group archaeon]MBL7116547.1 hypothetical protein [Nanoarchaeota archaeon]
MNQLVRIIGGTLLTTAAITIIGCSSTRVIKDYTLPEPERPFVGSTFERLSYEELLKKTIDDVIASDLLDSTYTQKLDSLSYGISTWRWKKPGGFYNTEERHAHIFIKTPDDEDEYLYEQNILLKYLFHELAHDYWENELSDEQREAFTEKIKHYHREFIEAKKEFLELASDTEADIFTGYKFIHEKHGFKDRIHDSFTDFFSTREYYERYYGEKFEENFYGTEAFAFFLEYELRDKSLFVAILHRAEKSQSVLAESEKKIAEREILSIIYIPEDLLPFYEGLLHEKFFEN